MRFFVRENGMARTLPRRAGNATGRQEIAPIDRSYLVALNVARHAASEAPELLPAPLQVRPCKLRQKLPVFDAAYMDVFTAVPKTVSNR
jgi:hypothetical protein